jgi:hypothetical protein
MVTQYPHYMYVVETVETQRDAKGNYIPTTETERFVSKCREETNGKGRQIERGGEFIVFSSLIQLPLNCETIKEGSVVQIYGMNDDIPILRIKGKVLKFDKGQLHNRLWI